jgi:hypothetical protein
MNTIIRPSGDSEKITIALTEAASVYSASRQEWDGCRRVLDGHKARLKALADDLLKAVAGTEDGLPKKSPNTLAGANQWAKPRSVDSFLTLVIQAPHPVRPGR